MTSVSSQKSSQGKKNMYCIFGILKHLYLYIYGLKKFSEILSSLLILTWLVLGVKKSSSDRLALVGWNLPPRTQGNRECEHCDLVLDKAVTEDEKKASWLILTVKIITIYMCLAPNVTGIGSRFIVTLIRVKRLLKLNEWTYTVYMIYCICDCNLPRNPVRLAVS